MSWGWGQPTFWGHHAIVTDGHGGLPGAVSLGPLYALSLALAGAVLGRTKCLQFLSNNDNTSDSG